MCKILSLPSEVDAAKGFISSSFEISHPPDYVEWFNESANWYSQFGLSAHLLLVELCTKYGIKKKTYNSCDRVEYLSGKLQTLQKDRQQNIEL